MNRNSKSNPCPNCDSVRKCACLPSERAMARTDQCTDAPLKGRETPRETAAYSLRKAARKLRDGAIEIESIIGSVVLDLEPIRATAALAESLADAIESRVDSL